MAARPPISDAELKVMQVLWERSPQSGPEIIESLASDEEWHPSTTKTLLGRLCRKKMVRIRPGSKPFLYEPGLSRESFLEAQSKSFLERFFGGSIEPFLVHFARREKLTEKEMDELRLILTRKKRK
jgi:BlaI family penicillinase repressor